MDEISKELDDKFVEMTSFITGHIEKFAAAFIKETGLDPTKVKMVQQRTKDGLSTIGTKIWFEPFPKESEIELYRVRAMNAKAQLAEAEAFMQLLVETQSMQWIEREFAVKALIEKWEHRNDKPEEAGNCQIKEVGEIKLTAIFPEWKEPK